MRSKTHVSATTGIAVIALVLLVVGFVLPGWFVINIGEVTINIGLWSMESCAQKVCTSLSIDEVLSAQRQEMASDALALLSWSEYQVEATLTLVGAFLSICLLTAQTIVICVSKVNTPNRITVLAALGACTSIGSAILGFIVVGRMANVIFQVMAVFPLISSPYALITFGIGSFVFVCVCGMELALRGMIQRDSQPPYTTFQNAVALPDMTQREFPPPYTNFQNAVALPDMIRGESQPPHTSFPNAAIKERVLTC